MSWPESAAKFFRSAAGAILGLAGPYGPLFIGPRTQSQDMLFIGDSLTSTGNSVTPFLLQGQMIWNGCAITGTGFTNTWIAKVTCPSTWPTGAHTLENRGDGFVRITRNDEGGPGAWTDITKDPFTMVRPLSGGDGPVMWTRLNTAPPAANTWTMTNSSTQYTQNNYDLRGFPAWLVGALGNRFKNYVFAGITGTNTKDTLLSLPRWQSQYWGCIHIQIGNNDSPADDAAVATLVADTKSLVLGCRLVSPLVIISEQLPDTNGSLGLQGRRATAGHLIRDWAATIDGVLYNPTFSLITDPDAYTAGTPITQLAGVFAANKQDTFPFGGYLIGGDKGGASIYKQMFWKNRRRDCNYEPYSATLKTGSWGSNPLMRGILGTYSGGSAATNKCTGTPPPTGWSMALNGGGATQQLDSRLIPATAEDGWGNDWWVATVYGASGSGSDQHNLTTTVNVPAQVQTDATNGLRPYMIVPIQCKFFGMEGAGLLTFEMKISGGSGASTMNQSIVFNTSTTLIASLSNEQPMLVLTGAPIEVKAGVTSFTLTVKYQAAINSTGSGTVGVREFDLQTYIP